MTATVPGEAPSAECWDRYWRGNHEAGGAMPYPATEAWWQALLLGVRDLHANEIPAGRVAIDLGTGDGTLVTRFREVWAADALAIHCVDISSAAVHGVCQRHAGVEGIVADVRQVPIPSASCALVASQFGVEYGGMDGVIEAARLVAPGGTLAMLLHHDRSRMHLETLAALAAIRDLRESRFIALARAMFSAGYDALAGAGRDAYDEAGARLQPAVGRLEAILAEHGAEVAGGVLAQLHEGVARIHENLARHDRDEVLGWLAQLEIEFDAIEGRFASICEAALDEEAFTEVCGALLAREFYIAQAGPLLGEEPGAPVAWALTAVYRPGDVANEPQPATPAMRFRLYEEREVERAELERWMERTRSSAIAELMERKLIEDRFFEVRTAWVLPFQILLGRLRRPRDSGGFTWFITGAVPTDVLDAGAGPTPRDAVRYFALKWQLAAARLEAGHAGAASVNQGTELEGARDALVAQAEALYALVEMPALWK